MHIKFISRGTGSAKSAETYLLQTHDHKGEVRQKVEVLRGNPTFVTQLADSLQFKHRYRSAVIAWHKDDRPTPEQVEEVLDTFENVAFSGLESDQYAYYAVWHGDSNGAGHIHIVTPRVELRTGKSFNIAPPGWQETYDVIRDKFNTKYDWARPDDLSRRRLVNNTINIHADTPHAKAKVEINEYIQSLLIGGTITNEADVMQVLNTIGTARRRGKAISLSVQGFNKSFRFGQKEGAVYERGFELDRVVKDVEAEQRTRAARNEADRSREVKRLDGLIDAIVQGRSSYNRSRYVAKVQESARADNQSKDADYRAGKTNDERVDRSTQADRERSPIHHGKSEQGQSQILDNTVTGGYDLDDSFSVGFMGHGGYYIQPHPSPNGAERYHCTDQSDQRQVRDKSMEQRNRYKERAERMERHGNGALDSAVRQRTINDRIRKIIEERIRVTKRAIQAGITERHEAIRSQLAEDREWISADRSRSEEHHRTAEPNTQQVRRTVNELADQLRQSAVAGLESNASAIDRQVNIVGRIVSGIRGWFENVAKSIEGVKNELEKLKLFKKAKEKAVSRERPNIKLTPWS